MKKLVLICTAAVVLMAFAMPVFAMEMYAPEVRNAKLEQEELNPAGFSGELTFGTSTDFDAANGTIAFSNFYVDGHVYPGEYVSVYWRTSGVGTWGAGYMFSVDYFSLTTDLGGYFGLPVGLEATGGRDSLYSREFEVTGHTWESTIIETGIDPLAWKFSLDADMVAVDLGLGFGEGSENLNDIGVVVTIPEVGPASAEVFYLAQDNADYAGTLGVDVQATDLVGGMLGVAAGFAYDTVDGAFPAYSYGFGVGVDYMGAAIGAGVRGVEETELKDIWVDVDYAFGDFGVTGAFAMSNDFAADKLDFYGADLSFYVAPEGSTWRAGYAITDVVGKDFDGDGLGDTSGYTYGGTAMGPEGGLYVVCDVDF